MKSWLGVIGRAILEFLIVLILISLAAGISASIPAVSGELRLVLLYSIKAALDLWPAAVVCMLFLAFFSFDQRVKSRILGWLGLFLLGALLFPLGLALRSVPALRELTAEAKAPKTSLRLQAPGFANQSGSALLWIGSFSDGYASDVVSVDFGADYPRLLYTSRSAVNPNTGTLDVQGRLASAALPRAEAVSLLPEARQFSAAWLWERLALLSEDRLQPALIAAAGFLLFALGFRFLCRISAWPLANAVFAAAGLVLVVIADASLADPQLLGLLSRFAGRLGFFPSDTEVLAGIEALLGLGLGAIDLAASPRKGRQEA